ncbi:GBF-interacting protein 1-like isoform X2 [Vitis vinifera]|uniref:GBF-interacting protein 1-like isoform X2 n=1 Tax=Vitis vinifera TaxID=29760 RepID=UPI00053FB44F|nr:GBF-interacting protein 1-like isoform X2 [Vitis vinifera]|eukprot:XP_010657491.1 PREDICTED: GBF-interacting protein 1-like isoform X2 [Vitis vinifera]
MSGGGFRVSISSSMREVIQNIKEVTGDHTEEEIYAMLKDCAMDPNETVQKLLMQDPFHEVRRKRDKRKEHLSNRDSAEPRWRPGMQGQGSRGGRVNYSSRHTSHGGGRNSAPAKENGISQISEKGIAQPTSQEMKNKETTAIASSITVMADGPAVTTTGNTSVVHTSHSTVASDVIHADLSASTDANKLGNSPSPSIDANKNPSIAFGTGDTCGQPTPGSSNCSASVTPASSSGGYFSASDPVLVPSHDSRISHAVGTIKREVGSQRTPVENNEITHAESRSAAVAASETGSSFLQGKMPGKSPGVGKNHLVESSQPSPSLTHAGSSVNRPSSNYNTRLQQVIGPQKVGPGMEWKPKSTNPNLVQSSGAAVTSEIPSVSAESVTQTQPVSGDLDSEEANPKPQKKLEGLHSRARRHVIIPNHIHVPEAERTGLNFGSFTTGFGVSLIDAYDPESDKTSTPQSETSQGIEETVEEHSSSNQNVLATAEEGDYPDHPESPPHVSENISSGEGDISSSSAPEYDSKQEIALPPGGHQYSTVHTSPNYSFGFVPPILGSQLAPFESSESQARDVTRLPSFVVQPQFDPASYYAQFYRSGSDSDGRISPFQSPGVVPKYNGNVAVLSPQTSQSPQEGGNSLVLSTAGATPLVTQSAGVMQSSIAVTQQPVPVFRQPGVHIPHYPPNYIPYGHYFSPFYVPPPAIHQFLANGAFPHQPQAGGVYPAPPNAAAAGVKYSLPQYKPGTNTGNSAHMGMPGGYGPYGSSPAGYNPSSAAAAGNSTANEEIAASQFKENSVYITGQQSEGSAVWIAAPGRDISGLPASSFYNLPPQSQHVAFTPTQGGHGPIAGIYHPAQAVTATVHPLLQQSQTMAGAVDMVGPTGSVYQQPQHAQINWPNNY